MVEFYISEKFIIVDESTLPKKGMVGDNTDYVAHFNFDDEWANKEKTARFIYKNRHIDVLLDNDTCNFPPEVLKSGFVEVGVYSGNLSASAGVRVPLYASILDKDGLPADPTPDVYAQLMERLENLEAATTGSVTIRNWTAEDVEGVTE